MYHGITNQFLYSAYKIQPTFVDSIGNIESFVGTCFFVKNRNDDLWLITNRHVLDISFRKSHLKHFTLNEVKISGKIASGNNFPSQDSLFQISVPPEFSKNMQNDIACIKLPRSNKQEIRIDYFLPYSIIASSKDFQERLEVCDFLAFPGFPEWHDERQNRPILRTGTISSDPRFDYSYKGDVSGACVAYEAFSYGGSSGSPVFAVQKGPKPGPGIAFSGFRELLLVGINAGHLKTSDLNQHSGISYFYKSSAILEIIDT